MFAGIFFPQLEGLSFQFPQFSCKIIRSYSCSFDSNMSLFSGCFFRFAAQFFCFLFCSLLFLCLSVCFEEWLDVFWNIPMHYHTRVERNYCYYNCMRLHECYVVLIFSYLMSKCLCVGFCVCVCVSSACVSLSILNLYMNIFDNFYKVLDHSLFQFCFCLILSLLSSGTPIAHI